MEDHPYSYYDDLRKDDTGNFEAIFNQSGYVGRNLHRYKGQDTDEVVICHTPVFVRYTKEGEEYSAAGYGSSAGTIMAVQHWNTGNGVVVKEIQDIQKTCPIRFTTEIFDTQSNPVPAVKGLTDMMIRSPADPKFPQPCAIVGTIYSSVSTKFAITSGVYDLLQVAPGASSDLLDNRKQYPLFTRTHPADGGSALLLPQYFHEVMNITNFAIVYVADDGFGDSYAKVIKQFAEEHGMNCLSVPVSYERDNPSKDEIKRDLKSLDKLDLNYIIGVFFFDSFKPIMEAAAELGVAGPGKFWFFAGSLSDYLHENYQTFERDSILAKAVYGSAIITDGGAAAGTDQYEAFLKEWKKMGDTPEILNYINSKQPGPPADMKNFNASKKYFYRDSDFFYKRPNHIAIYSYEAIIGIGLAACQALNETNSTLVNGDVFTGNDHHSAFLDVDFTSASGKVVVGPTTYSRNETSTYFVVANIIEHPSEENDDNSIRLQGKDHIYYDPYNFCWKKFDTGASFMYSDGTTTKPSEIPTIEENMNLISNYVRGSCLILCAISMATSLGFLIYTVKHWNSRTIRLAQPHFLVLICAGTFLMAFGIVPLSMDEGVMGQQGLNVSCSSVQWFFSFGFTITFAALFSKLWRANKVLMAAQVFRRVTVTIKDVLKPFAILFCCNAIILSAWEWGPDRPKWERRPTEMDDFDRVVSSEGKCSNHGISGLPYFTSLVIVNGMALVLACYQAYLGRDLGRESATELNESKYIAMAMICICECGFFAIPLLFISNSNRSGVLFVMTSLSFVICISTLLFIFVPKVLREKNPHGNRSSTATTDSVPRSVPRISAGGNPSLGRSIISGLSERALQIRFTGSQLSRGSSRKCSPRSSIRSSRRGTFKWNKIDLTKMDLGDEDDGDTHRRGKNNNDYDPTGHLDGPSGEQTDEFLPQQKNVTWQERRESYDNVTSYTKATEDFACRGDSSLDTPVEPNAMTILSHVSEKSELEGSNACEV